MFWPRCQLTKSEEKYVSKYFDLDKKRVVYRKIYNGFLALTAIQRQPTFAFAIARRCRVFAMTASGDISQFKIQVQESAGEAYFADFIAAPNIFGGFNQRPGSAIYPNFTQVLGFPFTLAPFVFEPNIVLKPNQTINLIGQEMTPFAGTDYRLEVCFHVWEYPGYCDGPV